MRYNLFLVAFMGVLLISAKGYGDDLDSSGINTSIYHRGRMYQFTPPAPRPRPEPESYAEKHGLNKPISGENKEMADFVVYQHDASGREFYTPYWRPKE